MDSFFSGVRAVRIHGADQAAAADEYVSYLLREAEKRGIAIRVDDPFKPPDAPVELPGQPGVYVWAS